MNNALVDEWIHGQLDGHLAEWTHGYFDEWVKDEQKDN